MQELDELLSHLSGKMQTHKAEAEAGERHGTWRLHGLLSELCKLAPPVA